MHVLKELFIKEALIEEVLFSVFSRRVVMLPSDSVGLTTIKPLLILY
jgi:hypothetical protein